MNKQKKQLNGKIEFLRFAFSICIILYHCHRTLGFDHLSLGGLHIPVMAGGRLGPDFFFVTAGVLMAASLSRERLRQEPSQTAEAAEGAVLREKFPIPREKGSILREKALEQTGSCGSIAPTKGSDLGERTLAFMKKKYLAIFPYHAICFAALFLFRLYSRELWKSASDVCSFLAASVPEFLLLQKFGFPEQSVNIVEWYLSAMLIAMAVIYPLAASCYSLFARVIAPVLGLGILGCMTYMLGTFSDQDLWLGFVQAGVLRAFAEISLGISVYEASKALSEQRLTTGKRWALTAVEVVSIVLVFCYLVLGTTGTFELQVLLCMMVSVALIFSGQTFGSRFFQQKWILQLGRLNLCFYLSQLLGLNIVRLWIVTPSMWIRCVLVLVISLVFALVVQFLGDRLKPRFR